MKMNELEPFQTDHLFLLIGTNPLPNYIASLLLAKEGGTIHLLHSKGDHGTERIAKRLSSAIKKRKPEIKEICSWEVDEANSNYILQRITDLLGHVPPEATVGLHYTGGTKAMAVHVYRAISEGRPKAIFSYLDARTLSMMIDGMSSPIKLIPDDMGCALDLAELIHMHGYKKPIIRYDPFQPDLCRAMAKIYSQEGLLNEWQRWIREKKFQSLPDIDEYPTLKDVIDEFDRMCGQPATPDLVARCLGFKGLVNCSNWLKGTWLEEYTLWAINQIAENSSISSYSVDVKLERARSREFQLDVAAIIGYQLFAISCMASKDKDKCKEHLLEVAVRARQIGGDEARIGLVCCYPNPGALEEEINEAWFTEGRVKVFGMKDLPELPIRLQNWFKTANGPQIE
jgi:hypothetical protein